MAPGVSYEGVIRPYPPNAPALLEIPGSSTGSWGRGKHHEQSTVYPGSEHVVFPTLNLRNITGTPGMFYMVNAAK
ncbi:MAG: hypothetical protein R2856_18835 [Caldilineaceae bacterium]